MLNLRKLSAVFAVFFILRFALKDNNDKLLPAEYVAHGGGVVMNERITNSLEALNQNYDKGFRFFEMDIEKTTDNRYILIHDWGRLKWLFDTEPEPCSLEEFMNLKMVKGLTQMTLDDLLQWLEKHPDAYIITDVKTDNMGLLRYIKRNGPEVKGQVIPQAYSFAQYYQIRSLGYKNIILTLYKVKYTPEQIIKFAEKNRLLAVTIYKDTAKTDFPVKLEEKDIFIYTHTINEPAAVDELVKKGVDGFYTDYLDPNKPVGITE